MRALCHVLLLSLVLPRLAVGDETCMSPYMAKIEGQEDVVYVWTHPYAH